MDNIQDKDFSLQLLRRTAVVVEQNIDLEKELAKVRTNSHVLEKELQNSTLRVAQLEHALLSQQKGELETLRLAADKQKNTKYCDHGCQTATEATTASRGDRPQVGPIILPKKTTASVATQTQRDDDSRTPLQNQPEFPIRAQPRTRPASQDRPDLQIPARPTQPRTHVARHTALVASTGRNPFSSASNTLTTSGLPASRAIVLAEYSGIKLPQEAKKEFKICFSRAQLTATLGGGPQRLIGNIATPKPLALQHNITRCLFPTRELNVWLPKRPGEHGYMFVGLRGKGGDRVQFMEDDPPPRSLFIPAGKGKDSCYYGEYIARRNPKLDLTKEEWRELPEDFKSGYCDCTLHKRETGSYKILKKDFSRYRAEITRIRQDYDTGNLRVPCVVLQCVGYKEELVPDLLAHVKKQTETEPSKSRSFSKSSLGKRRRALSDEGDSIEMSNLAPTPMEAGPSALRKSKRPFIYVPSRESSPLSLCD